MPDSPGGPPCCGNKPGVMFKFLHKTGKKTVQERQVDVYAPENMPAVPADIFDLLFGSGASTGKRADRRYYRLLRRKKLNRSVQ